MNSLTCIILDDEPRNVQLLKKMLAEYCPQVQVLATESNAGKGLALIKELQPQLLFLDIEMPGMNGFELLEKCMDTGFAVIFTTAYNEYAIQAIRHSALDYLLKPVDKNELIQAVVKAQKQTNKDSGNIETRPLISYGTVRFAQINYIEMERMKRIIGNISYGYEPVLMYNSIYRKF